MKMNDDRPAFLDPTIGIAGEPSLCKALMSELKAKGATVGASIETADCVVFAAGQNVSPTLVDALDLARGRATELSRFRTLIAISAPPDANH